MIVIIDLDPADAVNGRFLISRTLGKHGTKTQAAQMTPQRLIRNPFLKCAKSD